MPRWHDARKHGRHTGLRRLARLPCRGHRVPVLPVWRPAGRAGAGLLLPRRCCPASPPA